MRSVRVLAVRCRHRQPCRDGSGGSTAFRRDVPHNDRPLALVGGTLIDGSRQRPAS